MDLLHNHHLDVHMLLKSQLLRDKIVLEVCQVEQVN